MRLSGIENYRYFQGKKKNYLQLFIAVEHMRLEEADREIEMISEKLASKLTKEWKYFPDKSLPESYNIFTLPYTEFVAIESSSRV